MSLIINKKLLIVLLLSFIFTTIIGTLSHECGHYIAATLMGIKAHISYGMTSFIHYSKNVSSNEWLWIIVAGPLQTMLTGTVGFLLLFKFVKPTSNLSFTQWILVFLALFWLRQPANLFSGIANLLATGNYPQNGDEIKLSRHFNIPGLAISIVTAIIGIIISTIVVFKFVPVNQRFTFILAGITGGLIGAFVWLCWLGPVIMP